MPAGERLLVRGLWRAGFLAALLAFAIGIPPAEAQPLAGAGSPAIDFSRIDAYVAAMPKFPSAAKVAAALGMAASTEWEKARAVYDWVCLNIAYDTDAYFSGNLEGISGESAFLTGRSVCSGYSELILELAGRLGLKAVSVDGWAKGYGFSASEKLGEMNHAWNAFMIDGAWHLMDGTWGAGAIDENGKFRKELSHAWFAMDPRLFFYTHLPGEVAWSLLAARPGKSAFESQPFVQPYVFESFHGQGFPADYQKKLIAEFGEDLNDMSWMAVELAKAGFSQAQAVSALGGRPSEELFHGVLALGRFGFPAADLAGYLRSGLAPKAYKLDVEVRIVEAPRNPLLKIGSTYFFKLRAPGASAAAVICGRKFTALQKDGDIFSGYATVTAGPVKVSFEKKGDDPGTFYAAFEYGAGN